MAPNQPESTQLQHNLTSAQTSFVGRRQTLLTIKRLLTSTTLLTLTGSAGSGKTRLARQVAADLVGHYPDGVWWVDLATATDSVAKPFAVAQAVAAVLGLRQQPGHSLTDLIVDYLHNRTVLLVLDNCEHVRAACAALLEPILAKDSATRVLATSREPLGLPGENRWIVPMLALPNPQGKIALAQLQQVEAICLFDERARMVAPAFTLHEGNAAAVVQICRRLDGLPLALELAAARVNVLTPQQIAARLDDSVHLLTRCAHASDARHTTLRLALDWSFDLLSPCEQAFFVRLAVFAGNFSLEALENICSGHGLNGAELLDLLASLVEKSLIVVSEAQEVMRYRLLEPIRQYALEKLRGTGAETHWRTQHANWYAALAERAEPAFSTIHRCAWLEQLTQEHDNLCTALVWYGTTAQVAAGLALANALCPFWRARGYFSEGEHWFSALLDVDQALCPPAVRSHALSNLARLHHEQSNFSAARDLNEQALHLARLTDDEAGIALTLVELGATEWELGDFPAAYAHLAEAVRLSRALHRAPILSRALRLLGLVHWSQGDLFAAHTCCAESLTLARQMEDAGNLANALFNLALMSTQQGEYVEARRLYEECLAVSRQLGDQAAIADVSINLGGLAVGHGEFAAATRYFETAAKIHEQRGDQGDIAYSLAGLADIAFYTGNFAQARSHYQAALARFRSAGNKRMMGRALGWLSCIACREGDLMAAAAFCAEALTLRHAIGHKAGVLFSLEESCAELALALNQPAVAGSLLAVAHGLCKEMSRTRQPVEARAVEQRKAHTQALLGDRAFATAWAAGQEMALNDAVNYALESLSAAAVAQPQPELRIYALGPIHIYRGEQLLTSSDWVYAKARELVLYLLMHPGATREQIGVEFWPDASPEQVRKRFSAALAHARNALGRGAEWIILCDGRYRINRARSYWFDVETFEARWQEARRLMQNGADRSAISALLEEVVNLYQGDFAEEMVDGEWQVARAFALRQNYLSALTTLGSYHAAAGRDEPAITCFQRALANDAYLEEAHLELIRCFARGNQRGRALRQYKALTGALAELNATPSPEGARFIQRVCRGEAL